MKHLNTVWISTAPRAGSMWVFNITREINKISDFIVLPTEIPHDDETQFSIYENQALKDNNNKNFYVLKIHNILKQNIKRSKIITVIRDPRDLCASFKEFQKVDFNKALQAGKDSIRMIKKYKDYDRNYLLTIKYENIENSPLETTAKIAKFINKDINENQTKQIVRKFTRENVKKIISAKNLVVENKIKNKIPLNKSEFVSLGNKLIRTFDEKTGFQTNHISNRKSGEWQKNFSDDEIKVLNGEFSQFLKDYGYD